ncbi:MAG: YfhO family protein [Lachnospiraceae bacterium]|nr:YfhO family protein [Lachnospiraceae bacterium]
MEKAKTEKRGRFLQKLKEYRMLWAGLLMVTLTYIIIFAVKGYYPFGDEMLVSGDSLWQYVPFLSALREKIVSGESLDYSWSGSIGSNFYYLFAYYLASPLSALLLLFPVTVIYKIINISMVVKALLAFVTIYVYLAFRPSENRCEKNGLPILFFSLAYVFCNAFINFITFYPFLDCLILFPLVMLGLERFVADQGWKLYFVALALLMICNFYFGFMCCLFIVLYYFTMHFGSFRSFLRKSLKILVISVVAVGVSSYLCIPVMCELSNGAYGISEFQGIGFFTNWFNVIQEMLFYTKPVFSGQSADSYWEVNLYMGMLTLFLAFSYFVNRRISFSSRLKKGVLFLVLLLSFNESLLNYIFHLLHYTHGQPNRQAIFFVFLCIVMGQESLKQIFDDVCSVGKIKIAIIGAALGIITILTMFFAKELGYVYKYLYTLDLIIVYTAILLLRKRFNAEKNFVAALVMIASAELIVSAVHACPGVSVHTGQQLEEKYTAVSSVVEELQKEDDSFYHVATNNMTELDNYGYLVNYNGLNAFLSTCNVNYIAHLRQFGMVSDLGKVSDYTGSPFLYSILNMKYILSDQGQSEEAQNNLSLGNDPMNQYRFLKEKKGISVYVNDRVLSPVIVAEQDFSQYEKKQEAVSENSVVTFGELQNAFLEELCGVNTLFQSAEVEIEEVTTENCRAGVGEGIFIVNNAGGSNVDEKVTYNPNKNSYITVKGKAKEDCDLYVDMLFVDHIGEVKKGEEFEYTFVMKPEYFNEMGLFMQNCEFQKFDAVSWEKAYGKLKNQQMKVDDYRDGYLKGTLTSDGKHTVFTSIPYDANWVVWVDGEKVETKNLLKAYLSFNVEDGQHEIEMKYSVSGLGGGVSISIFSIIIFFVYLIYDQKKQRS